MEWDEAEPQPSEARPSHRERMRHAREGAAYARSWSREILRPGFRIAMVIVIVVMVALMLLGSLAGGVP